MAPSPPQLASPRSSLWVLVNYSLLLLQTQQGSQHPELLAPGNSWLLLSLNSALTFVLGVILQQCHFEGQKSSNTGDLIGFSFTNSFTKPSSVSQLLCALTVTLTDTEDV